VNTFNIGGVFFPLIFCAGSSVPHAIPWNQCDQSGNTQKSSKFQYFQGSTSSRPRCGSGSGISSRIRKPHLSDKSHMVNLSNGTITIGQSSCWSHWTDPEHVRLGLLQRFQDNMHNMLSKWNNNSMSGR
jgi:hypothetical protein